MKVEDLRTIQDIIKYWRECLADTKSSDVQIAYNMTRVVSSDLWELYYKNGQGDKDFIAIFDNVADLEIPQGDEAWRKAGWDNVETHLKSLEGKYPEK